MGGKKKSNNFMTFRKKVKLLAKDANTERFWNQSQNQAGSQIAWNFCTKCSSYYKIFKRIFVLT